MRVGVLSDVHGNLEALQAVLGSLHSPEVGGPNLDAIWCLGDLVGYGPDPNACVDIARASCWQCVGGNHDLTGAGSPGLDFFNTDAAAALEWTGRQLRPENRAYLAALPRRLDLEGITLVHGSPRDPVWEYVHSTQTARENFGHFDTSICLVGHTHVPAIFRQADGATSALAPTPSVPREISNGRFIVNPGSVGQPRDGDARAAFGILDLNQGTVTHYRVAYASAKTREKMLAAGLPARLAARLDYGC